MIAQHQMQEKTSLLGETSIKLGLRPNESKTKVMKINVKRNNRLVVSSVCGKSMPISSF
jgi:hypothetical protein